MTEVEMLLSMCGPDLLTYLTPPFFLITLPSSMMLWRALYQPPHRHPSLGPISIIHFFDSMQVCQTKTDSLKNNQTRFLSTSNGFSV